MALEVKIDKETTVEDNLKALNNLQNVMSDIDKIRILRGELPFEVQDLEDEIAGLQTRLDNYGTEITNIEASISSKRIEIKEAEMKVAKYKDQQENVRNSREYDALSKEVEFQSLEMELCEKRIREFTASLERLIEEKSHTTSHLEDRKLDLSQKKSELDEIITETRQEEEDLRETAKGIEARIEDRLLAAFKRIRKNARNGLALVPVERDACGGCFNKIPAQRQLDIRLRKKVIVCEYCGRVLVDRDMSLENQVEL